MSGTVKVFGCSSASHVRAEADRAGDRDACERALEDVQRAIALHSAGRSDEAMTILRDGLAKHPEDRDILLALMRFSRDAGDIRSALEYAERLARIAPHDQQLAHAIEDLRSPLNTPNRR
jgi:Flp pilus assembly protein TadD